MFLDYFGLRENPFELTADARYLYFGEEHREAVSAIYLGIVEGRGIGALVAPSGMGKTILLRYLAARLKSRAVPAFLSHPFRGRADLIRSVLERLGLDASDDGEFAQMARLRNYLDSQLRRNRKVVLLFDEAQALSLDSLEQIRLLSNLRTSHTNLLDIVVAGQPSLATMLQLPDFEALRQRIGVLARIYPFGEKEVGRYIGRRLEVAGGAKDVFTRGAVKAIARISEGVPRNINNLCHGAMALGWADNVRVIGVQLVREAAGELDWSSPQEADRTAERAGLTPGAAAGADRGAETVTPHSLTAEVQRITSRLLRNLNRPAAPEAANPPAALR